MITTVTLNASIDKAYHMDAAIENGTVMRVSSCRNTAGGKGLNVARVVRLCGSEVTTTGFVGGFNGSYLESLLDEDGIPNGFCHIQGETRSCINILDPAYGSTEYLEPGCEVLPGEVQEFLEEVYPAQIGGSDVVTLSGSIPKGVSRYIYRQLVERAKAAGKQVILDTSGDLLQLGMEGLPTMVKPNRDELELLFGRKVGSLDDVRELAGRIFAKGIPYVVVSLGGDGALMVCGEGTFRARSPKIEVVNTVGCGDSMVGAFAVALERKMGPADALRYASAVASANAASPNTGDFDPKVRDELLGKVEVERLG
jgi:tagatose 6-phosphate kinase